MAKWSDFDLSQILIDCRPKSVAILLAGSGAYVACVTGAALRPPAVVRGTG